MADRETLVIDDIERSLRTLTPLGRELMEAACESVRRAVLDVAERRHWAVSGYNTYASWAQERMSRHGGPWIVLDPLLLANASEANSDWCQVRVTRTAHGPRDDDRALECAIAAARGRPIGIVDDAAASGSTLRHVMQRVSGCGAQIGRVLLGASTRRARHSLQDVAVGVEWEDRLPWSDWRIMHLRDGCAYLPFAGRRNEQGQITTAGGAEIEIRYPSTSVPGNVWQVLQMDARIRNAMRSQRLAVMAALEAQLGRRAIVADLALIGSGVPAYVEDPAMRVELSTPLAACVLPHGDERVA